MRRLICLATALSLLAGPALAARDCPTEADQSIYEVLALRQEMTVLVTKCTGMESAYNDIFIKRFRPALQQNDREVLDYFRGLYGGRGQAAKDTFMTDLVNILSHEANQQGAEFCPRADLMVNELAALRGGDELAEYAAVKDLPPPGFSMCPAPRAARGRRGRRG
jgi:hypothetical protein